MTDLLWYWSRSLTWDIAVKTCRFQSSLSSMLYAVMVTCPPRCISRTDVHNTSRSWLVLTAELCCSFLWRLKSVARAYIAKASLPRYDNQMENLNRGRICDLRALANAARKHWMQRLPKTRMHSCHSSHNRTTLERPIHYFTLFVPIAGGVHVRWLMFIAKHIWYVKKRTWLAFWNKVVLNQMAQASIDPKLRSLGQGRNPLIKGPGKGGQESSDPRTRQGMEHGISSLSRKELCYLPKGSKLW